MNDSPCSSHGCGDTPTEGSAVCEISLCVDGFGLNGDSLQRYRNAKGNPIAVIAFEST